MWCCFWQMFCCCIYTKPFLPKIWTKYTQNKIQFPQVTRPLNTDKALACLALLSYVQNWSLLICLIRTWWCRASANCFKSRMIYWWGIDQFESITNTDKYYPTYQLLVVELLYVAVAYKWSICMVFLHTSPKIEQQQNVLKVNPAHTDAQNQNVCKWIMQDKIN